MYLSVGLKIGELVRVVVLRGPTIQQHGSTWLLSRPQYSSSSCTQVSHHVIQTEIRGTGPSKINKSFKYFRFLNNNQGWKSSLRTVFLNLQEIESFSVSSALLSWTWDNPFETAYCYSHWPCQKKVSSTRIEHLFGSWETFIRKQ